MDNKKHTQYEQSYEQTSEPTTASNTSTSKTTQDTKQEDDSDLNNNGVNDTAEYIVNSILAGAIMYFAYKEMNSPEVNYSFVRTCLVLDALLLGPRAVISQLKRKLF